MIRSCVFPPWQKQPQGHSQMHVQYVLNLNHSITAGTLQTLSESRRRAMSRDMQFQVWLQGFRHVRTHKRTQIC